MTKKSLYAKIFFSVTTKDKMVFRMENFTILGVHWKIRLLSGGGGGGGGGFTKN